jgi:hypothetical protein
MQQMATVVERAISGQLEPVNGRRHDLLPWEQHRLDWAAEVGDVFQAEIADRDLLVAGKPETRGEVFHVDVDGEVHATSRGAGAP